MISKDKEYITRDRREVRIYAIGGFGDYPVHGEILFEDGWYENKWTYEGHYHKSSIPHPYDLIEREYPVKTEE